MTVLEQDIFTQAFENPSNFEFSPTDENNSSFMTEEEESRMVDESIDSSVKTDIENLLTNGYISQEITIAGHEFVLRTLTIGEELAVAEISDEYDGNFAQTKAVATATVAASLESIDGRPLMHSLGPDVKSNIRKKFQYIRNKWYWIIISELYEHYSVLLNRQAYAFENLKGK